MPLKNPFSKSSPSSAEDTKTSSDQIISEFPIKGAVCVYCGSSPGEKEEYTDAAISLGEALGKRNRTLVYGGGGSGLMGSVSFACRNAGGKTLGVVPHAIAEGGGEGGIRAPLVIEARSTIFVSSMHERKTKMAEAAEAGFFGLPGGWGTFEEVLEAITWVQLGIHFKPVIVLNVAGFYDPLKALVKNGVESGFIRKGNDAIVTFVDKPEGDDSFDWGEAALKSLEEWRPPTEGPLFKNWKGLSQT